MEAMKVYRRGLGRSALVMRGSRTVAEVFTDQEPGDQYATAALFAAAPALLAALEDITERYERLLVESRITKRDAESMREMLPFYTEQARAAIARAKGGV